MKKTYVKPCITVEYFTLNQSVAQSCGSSYGQPLHGSPEACAWVDASGESYWTTVEICGGVYDPNIEVGEGCYNAPSGLHQIFAS